MRIRPIASEAGLIQFSMCVANQASSNPLPGTRSPQPYMYPTCEDGILKGGPRDRVWTTRPYLSTWLIPLGKY